MAKSRVERLDHRKLVDEIVRRAGDGNVIHVDDPPTVSQKLQLAACRILARPIAIVPSKCATVEEWLERYAPPSPDA
jgi:hypothetical protein